MSRVVERPVRASARFDAGRLARTAAKQPDERGHEDHHQGDLRDQDTPGRGRASRRARGGLDHGGMRERGVQGVAKRPRVGVPIAG